MTYEDDRYHGKDQDRLVLNPGNLGFLRCGCSLVEIRLFLLKVQEMIKLKRDI